MNKEEKGVYKVSVKKHKELFPLSTDHLGKLHKIKYTYFKESDLLLVEEDLKKLGKYLCLAVAFFPSVFYFGWKETYKHAKSLFGNTTITTYFSDASKEKELKEYLEELKHAADV